MGSSKLTGEQPHGARPYSDDPHDDDHAETASMASAVLLDNMESYPEDELPAYSDTPEGTSNNVTTGAPSSVPRIQRSWYQQVPII